jgi:hypothetical protein
LQWFLNDGLDWTHLYAHLRACCVFLPHLFCVYL